MWQFYDREKNMYDAWKESLRKYLVIHGCQSYTEIGWKTSNVICKRESAQKFVWWIGFKTCADRACFILLYENYRLVKSPLSFSDTLCNDITIKWKFSEKKSRDILTGRRLRTTYNRCSRANVDVTRRVSLTIASRWQDDKKNIAF